MDIPLASSLCLFLQRRQTRLVLALFMAHTMVYAAVAPLANGPIMTRLADASFPLGSNGGNRGDSPFVQVHGPDLYLHGTRFRLLGANSYGILSDYLGIGSISPLNLVAPQRITSAAAVNLRAIRFWLDVAPSDYWFSRTYGIYARDPASYLAALDRLRDDARAAGVYLIPVFVSAYDQWSRLGNSSLWTLGSPSDALFNSWVRAIVGHFRDDPQVLWWEVANEPNHFSTTGAYTTNQAGLVAWMKDKYALIKSLDPNHPVEGGYNNTGNLDPGAFLALNGFMDIASIHIYEPSLMASMAGQGILDEGVAIDQFVSYYIQLAKGTLGKPLLFGEFNGDLATDPANPFASLFLAAVYGHSGDAALVWSWEEGTDVYRITPNANPTVVAALADWGLKFKRQ